jgi:hypothetical protein
MQFKAGEHVVEAALTVLSIVSYYKIEQLIERCPFNSYATECAGCDLSETLSQEALAILGAHRVGGFINWLAFRIVLDPPDLVSLIDGASFGFASHHSR